MKLEAALKITTNPGKNRVEVIVDEMTCPLGDEINLGSTISGMEIKRLLDAGYEVWANKNGTDPTIVGSRCLSGEGELGAYIEFSSDRDYANQGDFFTSSGIHRLASKGVYIRVAPDSQL